MQKTILRYQVDPLATGHLSGIDPLLQKIYVARGITDAEQLQSSLEYLVAPQALKDIDKAVDLLSLAIRQQQKIVIVGDFDADGATSVVLAILSLRDMGCKHVDYLVPNRFDFGYGLTPEIVDVAKRNQPDLIITVDNGISSIDGVKVAKNAGIDVIITDHHLPGESLPIADAIINPNQPNCGFSSKSAAGVGVIFYLMLALRRKLRDDNYFAEKTIKEPNLAQYLDLVALGTVADVVPLDKNNRIMVSQGIHRIRAGHARPGILALLTIAGRDNKRLVAADLGFALGPRLNAAGRLDDMSLGIECLLTEDEDQAYLMAKRLDQLNTDRKTIEHDMQQDAIRNLQQNQLYPEEFADESALPYGVCLYNDNWHQGVVGIVASRIKERIHRPVIAFALTGDGDMKGSARSIQGLHMRDTLALIDATNPGLIVKFGGHAMAAGLTLPLSKFEQFKQRFNQAVQEQLSADELEPVIRTDGELLPDQLDLSIAALLRNAGPWGQHFHEPLFDGKFKLLEQYLVGAKHLKMVLGYGHQVVDAIAFNVDMDLWPNQTVKYASIVYRLDINEYRGQEKLQLMVEYLEPSN